MNYTTAVFPKAKKVAIIIFITFISWMPLPSLAQKNDVPRLTKQQQWQLLDYQQDTVYGASVNRAYNELLKGKKSKPVIVAVIDEGVDITHEDLQGHIWTNTKEIAGNGIDDDKNGYIDDVHGWNFLGGKDGRNIYATNSEADREYARLLPEFAGKDSVQMRQINDYAYFVKVKKEHQLDSAGRNRNLLPLVSAYVHTLSVNDSALKRYIPHKELYYKEVEAYQPSDSVGIKAKKAIIDFYAQANPHARTFSIDSMISIGTTYMATLKINQALYKQVKSDDPLALRKDIVGDNPFDINDRHYGNNKVGDEFADHGTHCSGIISAIRNNGIGMDGVADNVIIMPVRAVNTLHYGDEMDKDIALAIRYAVDNGARIISMSFGKDLSPQKQWVDDAIKYAEKKGVLLVHAAGNEHADIDTVPDFPSPNYLNGTGRAANVINVGSISIDTGLMLPAQSSSYGQKDVDLFAPGVDIYSSIPGNKYEFLSGTSMATPVVAGVAALIMEYYPNLNDIQVKDIILRSVTSLKGKIVYRPGSKTKVDFATLCATGGAVNAYKALQLAAKESAK